jgi:threonine/homoserine/homoserine lactone efflux protein
VVSLGAVLGVAVVAFGLVVTPGPNMIYLVSRSLSQGRHAGFVSLSGVACGLVLYLLATSAGLAAVFVAVPALFVVIKLLGAAYLLYLAWGILRPRGRSVFAEQVEVSPHSARRLFSMGLATCLLNPKISLMYAALLPQFVDPTAGPTAVQLFLLGLVQIAVAVTVNAGWVLSAAWVAMFFRARPTAQRMQRWITGTVLGGFAVHLAVTPHRA